MARRAVRAACRWAFERGAPKVLWLAEVGNEASWRVAQAVGFQYEGMRRAELEQAGRGRVDAWSASLLPADLDGDHPLPFGPDPVLADGEVTVRRYQEADVGPWLALRNEPDVIARGYGGDRRRPLSGNEAWRELMVEGTEMRMTGRGMELAVVAGETLVGNMSFQRFGAGASLSWWSGAAARGRGTTSHAVRLLVAHPRGVGVPRVEARIHVANVASQRVAERAGLVRQGLLPRDAPWDDGPGDAYLYGTSLAEPVGKEAGDSAESRSTP